MKYGIQYLCHLVETKNSLNRRRRRFRAIARPSSRHVFKLSPMFGDHWEELPPKPEHKTISFKYAEKMYRITQLEMISMTKEMRALRTELGVKFNWTDRGTIGSIKFEGTKLDLPMIALLARDYRADSILLK